jgi:membrane-bound serine protease (ClpP class)
MAACPPIDSAIPGFIMATAAGNGAVGLIVTLIVLGGILLFLESLLPGMVAGAIGVACLIGGVVLGYVHYGMEAGSFILAIVVVGLLIGTMCWLKYFPNSAVAKTFISRGSVGEIGTEKPELVGKTGVAHTNLHPSGLAVLNGQRVDVVTEGNLIERGTPVEVIAVEGIRVVVRAIKHEASSTN